VVADIEQDVLAFSDLERQRNAIFLCDADRVLALHLAM